MGIGGDAVLSRLRGLAKMKRKLKPVKCVNCGTIFTPRTNTARYCCEKCKTEYLSAPETRTCTVCFGKYEAMRKSHSCQCPTCRGKKHISADVGIRKTKRCRFTPTNDNTPDGAKPEDMWMGEIPKPQMKPATAKPKGRKLPKAPYPPAHVRERPLHVPNTKDYRIMKHSSYTPEQDDVIRAMFDDGASWDEIGEEFGRTGDAVRRHAQIIFGGTLNRRRKNESM